jgi:hypothetical protein
MIDMEINKIREEVSSIVGKSIVNSIKDDVYNIILSGIWGKVDRVLWVLLIEDNCHKCIMEGDLEEVWGMI